VVHAAARRQLEDVLRLLLQRVQLVPLDQRVQLARALEDVQGVVVPAVLADQAEPAGRRRLRPAVRDALERRLAELQPVALHP
jgi:hypothetical protein